MGVIDVLSLLPTIKGIIENILGYNEKIRLKFNNALEKALKPTVKDDDIYIKNAIIHISDYISLIILLKGDPSSINTITIPNKYINREELRRFYEETYKDKDLWLALEAEWNRYINKDTNNVVKNTNITVKAIDTKIDELINIIKAFIDKMEGVNLPNKKEDNLSALYKCLDKKLKNKREVHPSFQLMKIDDRLFTKAQFQHSTFEPEAKNSNDELETVKKIVADSWKKGSNNHLMIEGEGGIGKTVTLLSLPEKFVPYPVPAIYIPLHELPNGDDPIENYVKKKILNNNDDLYGDLLSLVEKPWDKERPQLLLLLDGFNEISAERRLTIGQDIITWSERPGIQIITSSRFDIHTYVSLRGQYSAIKLQPLSHIAVETYMKSMDIPIPIDDTVKELLTNPLLLTLYAKTELILKQRETDSSDFREAKNAGSIVWNYLQCELWRFGIDDENAKNAIIAMEYIAPYIAWQMQQNTRFALENREFNKFLDDAYKQLEKHANSTNDFPFHIQDALQKADGLPSLKLIRSLLEKHLCVFVKYGKRYKLMHQQFRDALAAVHLINKSYLSDNEFPVEWKSPIDYYVIRFVADLIYSEDDNKKVQKLWNQNKELNGNESATRNQLRLQGLLNNNDFSHLDFSGLDLTNISLYPYRFPDASIKLPSQKEKMMHTKLSDKTFSPEGHDGSVNAVVATSDGKYIVSGSSDRTIRVWEIETGAQIKTMMGHEKEVNAVAVDKDVNYIISGSADKTIRIWDFKAGIQIGKPLKGHEGAVNAVAISGDGKLIVSGSSDNTVRVWDFNNRKILKTLTGHNNIVSTVAVNPEGNRIVSGSWDNSIWIWESPTGNWSDTDILIKKPLYGHEFSVYALVFSHDGNHVISGSMDKTIRVWDVGLQEPKEETLRNQDGTVLCIALTQDDTVLVCGSGDKTICSWDMKTMTPLLKSVKGHTSFVNSVAVAPDGKRIISGSSDKTIRVWSSENGSPVGVPIMEGHNNIVEAVVVTPDGKRIVSRSSDDIIRIWDIECGRLMGKLLADDTNSLYSIALTPDTKRIVRALSRSIIISDLETGKTIMTLLGHKFRVTAVVVMANNNQIISGSADVVIVWNLNSGEKIKTLERHGEELLTIAVTPDEKSIVGRSYYRTYIWDLETGKLTKTLKEPNAIGNIPTKKYEAGGSDDGTIRITDLETHEVQTIRVLPLSLLGLDFSRADISDGLREVFRQNGAKV